MASVILGTAGHIDHGKTALVRALTGTDTDRLKEEKARGITIELGFAELTAPDGTHFGVVDVPGHEAFVRAMLAGAAGMDVVLLVVAADEGVMPQTREHLSIVQLLDVPELVVAVTKCDASEEEWLELVEADVADTLAETRYRGAAVVRTSASEGTGLDQLLDALAEAAARVRRPEAADLARLPLDRVFTIQGTGTVVTGTLWSGTLSAADRVRVLPGDLAGRIRSLQVHGRDAEAAQAGDRTAVALTGDGGDRERVGRGATLVTDPGWEATWMLTTRVEMLPDTAWGLEHNQRVHVHLGTAEVLARCALLEDEALRAGGRGWVQLRLESPLVARAGDRFVIRAYSPVTTIGGGVVAEPLPPKRNRLTDGERALLVSVVDGTAEEALAACLELAGWGGVPRERLTILTGRTPRDAEAALEVVVASGALRTSARVFGSEARQRAQATLAAAVDAGHEEDGLRAVIPLAAVRASLPSWAPAELGQAVIEEMVANGVLEAEDGGVRRPGFRPTLSMDQEEATASLLRTLGAGGLAAPLVDELPPELTSRSDFWPLLRRLEAMGTVRQIADGLYVPSEELDQAAQLVRTELGGQTNLGPATFREVLPVTRKHLIPLLNYLDGLGVTVRHGDGRDVPETA